MSGLLADVPNPGGLLTPFVPDVGGWAFDKVSEGISSWILDAVSFFVDGAIDFLRTSSTPDVEAAWFAGPSSPYATVRNLAAILLLAFAFLGIVQGVIQGDAAGMVRRIAGTLPVAVLGMVICTAVVARLLALTDAASAAVLAGTDDHALHFLSGFGATAALGAGSAATGGIAPAILGLVAVLAGLLLWVELIIRSSLVYVLVTLSPMGFAATVWPAAKGVLRKTIELLLAVIVSKLVICVTLAIGAAALSGAGSAGSAREGFASGAGASMGTLLVGTALLGLAAFSPFLVLRLFPVAEAALVAHGVSRGPLRAAQSGVAAASSVQTVGRLAGGSSSSAGSAAASGANSAGGAGGAGVAGGGAGASAAGAAGGPAAVVAVGAAAARSTVKAAKNTALNAADGATAARSGSADAPRGERS